MTTHAPRANEIPTGVVSLADYERVAAERLDPRAWAYFAGGAGDEITSRWNREAFDRIRLLPRVLRGGGSLNTSITLLGRTFAHPILVAPVAYQKLAHSDGESGAAAAAAAQEAGFVLSTLASETLEDVAANAGPRRWLQLYLQPRREDTIHLVRRAEAAGYEALVLTVDAPVNGVRDRERRAGFNLPPGISAVNLAGYAPAAPDPRSPASVLAQLMALAPTWRDVEWLTSETRLPVLLKGILDPDDAEHAVAHGASGIIVSNHGGRTLDTAPATLEVLPAVAERIAGRIPVLVDGGARRGSDAFKALALGATAVLVGRPVVFGLAVAGALGASHVLRLLRDELEITMALMGCASISDIDPRYLGQP